MGEYRIKGGNRLTGQINPGGAKNAVLPILAATVLNGGKSELHNVPRLTDTFIALDILRALGCEAQFEDGVITVDSSGINSTVVPIELVKKMRSSIIFLGSLLGRFGHVTISFPGGCDLGLRSIDYHLKAMAKMGAKIEDKGGLLIFSAEKLTGSWIAFDTPSVGATQNVILASALTQGETVISNAAREPEIVDLAVFLTKMGAKIRGAGTGMVIVEGVSRLSSAEHTVIPDRIVAGTYLCAAAMTSGEITLTNVIPEHIYPIYTRLADGGCDIKEEKTRVHLRAPKKLKSLNQLTTQPHPGFPTDMQPQFMAMQCISEGSCVINETIFEARNKHIQQLQRMGAAISHPAGGSATIVCGVESLQGATVEAMDLRGGAALILAGLCAEGETIVQNSEHIERGYDKIEKSLTTLGADIKLV